ncbi:MAG: hypothetical protein K0Q64_2260 [Nitrobacter vulgaris]|nr:hypothetical protein [Nitrobacter vulgaris]
MPRHHGSKQITLQDRLSAWAEKTRAQADKLTPGPARDALLKKVAQAETAARYDAWSRSSGLQPPADVRRPPGMTARPVGR